MANTSLTTLRRLRRGGWLWLCVGLALASPAAARPALDTSDPVGFFTTVADKLLRNTFSFGVTNIPVYTNGVFVYSPAVQRLLQLSANIYDATTNHTAVCGRDYPSVFRPLFTATAAGDLYITGYTNVASVTNAGDLALAVPFDAALLAANGGTNVAVNVYGVPWIIGAKKGFPSFNQFYMLDAVQVTRRLQVTKPYFGAPLAMFLTNQMYLFSISNSLGCSLWNAGVSNYSGNLTILARDTLTMILTNDAMPAPGILNEFVLPIVATTLSNIWPGTIWADDPQFPALDANNNSFIIPFNGTAVLLTNSIYRYAGYANAASLPNGAPGFDPYNTDYQTNVWTPQLPHFGLLTTNRLQVAILDCDSNNITHVIDYVQFAGPDSSRDLNAELADPNSTGLPAYLWSTNLISAGDPNGTPWGVVNQIYISKGLVGQPNSGGYWSPSPNMPSSLPLTLAAEEAFFSGFFNVNNLLYGQYRFNGKTYTNTNLAVQAPYTPIRMLYSFTSWQANDPLVHFLVSDLNYTDPGVTGIHVSDDPTTALPWIQLANLSRRWSPWGQNYPFGPSVLGGAFLMQIKDPLVWRPEDWNFPAGADWSIAALGRVHRGTPWQTIYLKASDVTTNNAIATGITGLDAWAQWTGDPDLNDAQLTAPITDWQLLGVLIPLLNTNNRAQLVSVNDGNLADWQNALDGLLVVSNSSPDFQGYLSSPPFDTYVMAGGSAQAGYIANAIAQARAGQPGQRFATLGSILQTAALSENSPWLNWNDTLQYQYAITDAAYEAIPAQLLPRLRPDSIGAVVSTNGAWQVQFSGSDAWIYTLQTSPDLINWTTVSTNVPVQGSFNATIAPGPAAPKQFFRSVLLP